MWVTYEFETDLNQIVLIVSAVIQSFKNNNIIIIAFNQGRHNKGNSTVNRQTF